MGRALVAMLALCMVTGTAVMGDLDEIWQRNGREETQPGYTWIQRNWHPGDLLFLSNNAPPSFDYYAPKVGPNGLTQIWPPGWRDPMTTLEATANGEDNNPGYDKAYHPRPSKPAPSDVQGFVYVQSDLSHYVPSYKSNLDTYRAQYLSEVDNVCHPPANWNWPAVKRIWVVYTHPLDDAGFAPNTICLPEFEREADRVGELHEMGADVYLYLPSPQPNHP